MGICCITWISLKLFVIQVYSLTLNKKEFNYSLAGARRMHIYNLIFLRSQKKKSNMLLTQGGPKCCMEALHLFRYHLQLVFTFGSQYTLYRLTHKYFCSIYIEGKANFTPSSSWSMRFDVFLNELVVAFVSGWPISLQTNHWVC